MNTNTNTNRLSMYIIMIGFMAFIFGSMISSSVKMNELKIAGYFIIIFGLITLIAGCIFNHTIKNNTQAGGFIDDSSLFQPDPNMSTQYVIVRNDITTSPPVTDNILTTESPEQAIIIEEPTTSAPITNTPTTNAPTTSAPITNVPTTNAPITNPPTTSAPAIPIEAVMLLQTVLIINGNNYLGICDNCTDLCDDLLCPKSLLTEDCLFILESPPENISSVFIKNNKTNKYLTLCKQCYSSCPDIVCASGLINNSLNQFTMIRNDDGSVSFLGSNGKYLAYNEPNSNINDNIGCYNSCSPKGLFSCSALYINPIAKFYIIDFKP